jgi:hypothetical protein
VEIASILCLIEIYSGAPGEDEALACLGKLIAFRQKRRRDARKKGDPFVRPFLWIITAGRPTGVLAAMAAVPARGWPRGIYFSPGVLRDAHRSRRAGSAGPAKGTGGLLRVGIVVASELPRDRSTILVRLMAGGAVLAGAIADLDALPRDAHEHAVALQIVLRLRHALGSKPQRTDEEQEFIVSTENMVEKLHEEGRRQGEQAHARATLRRILSKRELAPSHQDEARIERCADLGTLDRWIEQALAAQSVDEALRVDPAPPRRRRAARAS